MAGAEAVSGASTGWIAGTGKTVASMILRGVSFFSPYRSHNEGGVESTRLHYGKAAAYSGAGVLVSFLLYKSLTRRSNALPESYPIDAVEVDGGYAPGSDASPPQLVAEEAAQQPGYTNKIENSADEVKVDLDVNMGPVDQASGAKVKIDLLLETVGYILVAIVIVVAFCVSLWTPAD